MPYKIAVTSTDGQAVNEHFGRAGQFYIYEVDDGGGYSLTELRSVQPQSEVHGGRRQGGCAGERPDEIRGGCSHDEAGIKPLIGALSGCRYVLTAQIGKRPQMLLKRAGITALESPQDLSEAVGKLHKYHIKINRREKRSEQ